MYIGAQGTIPIEICCKNGLIKTSKKKGARIIMFFSVTACHKIFLYHLKSNIPIKKIMLLWYVFSFSIKLAFNPNRKEYDRRILSIIIVRLYILSKDMNKRL